MKMPSRLLFTYEEKFINILIEMLSKLLQYGKVLKEKKVRNKLTYLFFYLFTDPSEV